MIVAPTEPQLLRALGLTALTPEQFGADIMFTSHSKLIGIQRKEYNDLLSSIFDGRIQKELAQMGRLSLPVLLIEGTPHFNAEGQFFNPGRGDGGSTWTRKAHHNFIASVQSRGIMVMLTSDIHDTIQAVLSFKDWLDKDSSALDSRPKPKGEWGVMTSLEWSMHLLQGFEGLGPKQARAVIEHFQGVPLAWTCTEAEMREVPGIGPKRTHRMFTALQTTKEENA